MESESPKPKVSKVMSLLRLLLFLCILGALAMAVQLLELERYLDRARLEGWLAAFGPWGPLAYMVLYVIATVLFVPGAPLTVAGGILFGPLYGTLYTIVAATIGASLAFLVARYLARAQVDALLSARLKSLDEGIARRGWVYVAVTRLVPLFPFNLLNYAFGLTSIPFWQYVAASFVFMLPGTAAYVILSSSLLDLLKGEISPQFILGLLLFIAVSLLPLLYKRHRQR